MSIATLTPHLTQPPTLFHLNGEADESQWGRSEGFPVLLFRSDELDEEAYQELSDAYGDVSGDGDMERMLPVDASSAEELLAVLDPG